MPRRLGIHAARVVGTIVEQIAVDVEAVRGAEYAAVLAPARGLEARGEVRDVRLVATRERGREVDAPRRALPRQRARRELARVGAAGAFDMAPRVAG